MAQTHVENLTAAPALHVTDTTVRRKRGEFEFELRVPALVVPRGQLIAVVGESGCGKSTLLDVLALVTKPEHSGSFEILNDGSLVDVSPYLLTNNDQRLASIRARSVGYVLQRGGLLSFLNVADNVMLSADVAGRVVPPDELDALLSELGILDRKAFKPSGLSGGQRQRAAIARALIHAPSVILADEPTAAVDEKRAQAIIEILYQQARLRQAAIVVVTHNRALVEAFADKVYVFDLHYESDNHLCSKCRPE